MTEAERKNTLRVLAKRNNQRLEALKARQEAEPANASDGSIQIALDKQEPKQRGNLVHEDL